MGCGIIIITMVGHILYNNYIVILWDQFLQLWFTKIKINQPTSKLGCDCVLINKYVVIKLD